jgi:hypothetical protein
MELRSALTRRRDVADRESLVERHRDECRFAGARMPLHTDALGIDGLRPRASRHLFATWTNDDKSLK